MARRDGKMAVPSARAKRALLPALPSFDHGSEVFQAASKDPVQTRSVFSAPAKSQKPNVYFSSSFSRSTRERNLACIFFHLFAFHEIAYLRFIKG